MQKEKLLNRKYITQKKSTSRISITFNKQLKNVTFALPNTIRLAASTCEKRKTDWGGREKLCYA